VTRRLRLPGLSERSPYLLVVAGIASVQSGAAVATKLFASVGPGGAVFLRILFGAIILALVWRPRIKGRTWQQLRIALLLGVVLGAMNFFFYHAIETIPIGDAVTIEFIGPLLVATVGSRRPVDLLWVLLAGAGVVALSNGGTIHLNSIGVLYAALAGVLWGTYIVVTASVGRSFTNGEGLALAMAVSALVTIPAGLIEGGRRLLDLTILGQGALIGLLSSAIPYAFEMEALRKLSKRTFGILMSIEPAMAAAAGFLIAHQRLSTSDLVGIALVVCASVGSSIGASIQARTGL
jgi:inner membrane transporter RhtA